MATHNNYKIPDSATFLRVFAMNWLRYEHGCHIITFERSPVSSSSRPDVLGMTKGKMLIEVEVKVSKGDLDRDHAKAHRAAMVQDIQRVVPEHANYMYYIVPEHMASYASDTDKIEKSTGILSLNHSYRHGKLRLPTVTVHRRASIFHPAKLSDASVQKMLSQQSSTMCSVANELITMALQGGKDSWDFGTVAHEEVPRPYTITPKDSVLDNGERTGRYIRPHEMDEQWKNPKFVDNNPKIHGEEPYKIVRHNDSSP
jgi:hypothetical protein